MPNFSIVPSTTAYPSAVESATCRPFSDQSPQSSSRCDDSVTGAFHSAPAAGDHNRQQFGPTIKMSCSPRAVDVFYDGPIDESGIKELVDVIEQGFALYQPERTTVHMRSPGGSGRAMEHWINTTNKWKKRGYEISTNAGTLCASAGAMIVTMGAVGSRYAHPLSEMLYHNPRVIAHQGSTFREDEAARVARMLCDSRNRINLRIKQHLTDSLGLLGFARTLNARAEWMLAKGSSLPTTYFIQDSSESNLPNGWKKRFTSWASMRIDDTEAAQLIVSQWENQINDLFKTDRISDLRFVWALLLIDESDDLPVLIERDIRLPEIEDHQTSDLSTARYTPKSAE